MQLALANWPPLLSHLILFVLGMGVHNLFMPTPSVFPRLKSGRLFIVLPKKTQLYDQVARGQQLNFVINKKGHRCRLVHRGANVHHLYRRTIVISLSRKSGEKIISHLNNHQLEGIFHLSDQRAQSLAKCQQQPLVQYGLP